MRHCEFSIHQVEAELVDALDRFQAIANQLFFRGAIHAGDDKDTLFHIAP